MANRFGQAYGLTVLSPIIDGQDAAVRDVLRLVNAQPTSPFADVPTTHLARWVVIDEAPFEAIPAKIDHLQSKYLLFTSNFDVGTATDDAGLEAYLEQLRVGAQDVLDQLYTHCVAFPGTDDRSAFRDYMKRCQIDTSFYFGAYPGASVEQVLRSLDAQRRMADFVAEQQDRRPSPEDLQRAFGALMTELADAPTPRPGIL